MYTFIETVFFLGIFINAALFVPQAFKLFREKSAKDLSLLTFGGFNLIQFTMVAHGFLHHDWLLVIGTGLSVLTCGMVTLQIIIYEGKTRVGALMKRCGYG
jgi:MtN3 and saliva related transmembrane protein